MIGLLMIKDESDMLAETLRNHARFCDAIFVLDGTTGNEQSITEEICRSSPVVQGYWTDTDTEYQLPLRDGARAFIHQRARAKYGLSQWYAILHGDEIWGQDPNEVIPQAPAGTHAIGVYLYHFFPHVSEAAAWSYVPQESSIEECSKHYMLPGAVEERLFFDSGQHDYEVTRHSKVIPLGIDRWQSELAIRQYNYRSPEQAHLRAVERRDSLWQQNHYQHLLPGPEAFFIETLASDQFQWAGMVPVGQGDATSVLRDPLPTLSDFDQG